MYPRGRDDARPSSCGLHGSNSLGSSSGDAPGTPPGAPSNRLFGFGTEHVAQPTASRNRRRTEW